MRRQMPVVRRERSSWGARCLPNADQFPRCRLPEEIERVVTLERDVHEIAATNRAGWIAEVDAAVHARSFALRPSVPGARNAKPFARRGPAAHRPVVFGQHAHAAADPARPGTFRSLALRLAQTNEAAAAFPFAGARGQRRSRRAFLRAVFEESRTIELGARDPLLE